MSEKRWALRKPMRGPISGHAQYHSSEFEEVHTFDPAKESAVPHDVLRACADLWEKEDILGRVLRISALRHYLPKPRPTLREAMQKIVGSRPTKIISIEGVNDACREAGIDPDKVYGEGDE